MDPVRDQLQQALGEAYRVERELGGGGMSRVFLATETALNRRVVLKVLPPELASRMSVERFQREITLAARLQHAHIVPLHAAGDADGMPWFSMPFVEGDSLRTRLSAGELPIAEVVRTLRDVASALAYAHGKGLVHRDIKPENILLAEGGAAVTDFGVAKALHVAGEAHGGTLTSAGVALGTPAYMAPEQIAADPRTDHRADVYAVGMVAYEMLTGHNPFAGRSPQATMAAHMTETPVPLAQARTSTPPALATLVMQCLAKSAADRPQSAQAIVQALDTLATPTGTPPMGAESRGVYPAASGQSRVRIAAIALGVVALAAGAWYASRNANGERGADTQRRRVAVVPFENLTGDKTLDVVGRVASEEFSRSIMQSDSADVMAGDAVLAAIGDGAIAGSAGVVARVHKATGAGIIVVGSYSKSGDSLRMQVSVIDATTGKVIRALDPTMGPVPDPMVAIAALRERLLGSIVSGDIARKVTVTSTPPKYRAYLEYLAGMREVVKSLSASRPFFERAIAIDSSFVAAYGLLTSTYVFAQQFDQAERVVARLGAQRDRLSATERLQADFYAVLLSGDAPEALQLAQELYRRTDEPSWAMMVADRGLTVLKPKVALDALMLSDSAMVAAGWLGQINAEAMAYHLLGDFRKELETLDRGIVRLPQFAAFYTRIKLRTYAALHDLGAARAVADELLQQSDRGTVGAFEWLQIGATEFAAHGDSAAGQQLNRQALDWARANAPTTASLPWERLVGQLWLFAGALDSAAAHFTRALPDTSANAIETIGYLAIVAARKGNDARARAVADSLAAHVPKWDRGRTPYWRAGILAELGDREQAMRLLTTAPRLGQQMMDWHSALPLRALRGYPPFEALIMPQK